VPPRLARIAVHLGRSMLLVLDLRQAGIVFAVLSKEHFPNVSGGLNPQISEVIT
jgi:hypothetical protein